MMSRTSQSIPIVRPLQQHEQEPEVMTLVEYMERYPHGVPLSAPYPEIVGPWHLRVRTPKRGQSYEQS